MFVVSNRNIILPSKNGDKTFPLSRGFIGDIPSWACETDYFAALVQDGKISIPKSDKDKDIKVGENKKQSRNTKNSKDSKETVQNTVE